MKNTSSQGEESPNVSHGIYHQVQLESTDYYHQRLGQGYPSAESHTDRLKALIIMWVINMEMLRAFCFNKCVSMLQRGTHNHVKTIGV